MLPDIGGRNRSDLGSMNRRHFFALIFASFSSTVLPGRPRFARIDGGTAGEEREEEEEEEKDEEDETERWREEVLLTVIVLCLRRG